MNRTVLFCLLCLLFACSPIRKARDVVDKAADIVMGEDESEVSFSLADVPDTLDLVELMRDLDVKATIESVENGITVIKLIGAYADLMKAINELVIKGIGAIVANNGFSQKALDAARDAAD